MSRTQKLLFVCSLLMALGLSTNVSRSQVIELESNFTKRQFDIVLRKSSYAFEAKHIEQKIRPFFSDFCEVNDLSELKQNGFRCNQLKCEIKKYLFSQGVFGGHVVYQEWNIDIDLGVGKCPKVNVSIVYKIVR